MLAPLLKIEKHTVDGVQKNLLVHRKGSTRAFPPHHPLIPVDYQLTGQPVLIGGTMGTCSYVLTGTEKGFTDTFGSTCHGAGRALSRAKSRRTLEYQEVLDKLDRQGVGHWSPGPLAVVGSRRCNLRPLEVRYSQRARCVSLSLPFL